MQSFDMHVHTNFCDGKDSAEDMLLAALDKGLETIGFSEHAYIPFDPEYSMSPERTAEYRAEIARLKEKYAGKIEVLCGTEEDYYSELPDDGYDYKIGSVHFVKQGERLIVVDMDSKALVLAADECFGGDIYSLCELYFDTVSRIYEKTHCDIIGHLDLIAKYNSIHHMFDENHPRYVAAWQSCVDKLLTTGAAFEVNYGAVFKGYRDVPYPALPIVSYIQAHGGKLILSSDSHCKEAVAFNFTDS